MKKNIVIGLNSGTSYDGIDVALVKFQKNNLKPYFIDGIIYPYPKKVKNLLSESRSLTTTDMSKLNFLLGEIFASAALKIIKKNKLTPKDILLIASHGQTIFHAPKASTLQISESSVIAHKTGIKTISNFRESDIACGGHGAPLMPFLDYTVFNKSKNTKAVLNIGGISNMTIVGDNVIPIAFDIGPGNALIDLIVKKCFRKDFDKDGKLAKRGKINHIAVRKALEDKYFKQKPPKSTGKEYFNLKFIKKYFSNIKDKKDKIATITFFSAKVIEKAFSDFIYPRYDIKEIIISGGGIKNKTLISHLKKLLPKLKLTSSDKYGLPYKYKEAILFALLGYTCNRRIKNNIPSCTGAKKKVILGKITCA